MKYLLCLPIALFFSSAIAQDCSQELLLQKPGTWKLGQQGSIANIAAIDLPKEKAVLANIHKMVSANYKPMGCQVSYSYVFSKHSGEGQTFISDPYHYAMYILRFLCDQNSADKTKYYVDISTPTTVNITANAIYTYNNLYAANIATDDARPYLKIKKRPEKRNGFYFLGEEVMGDSHLQNKIKEYRWLITYNDTLPFVYVTRKEYLLAQKPRLAKDIQDSPSEKAWYEKFLRNIDEYLKRPEDYLSKPAICMWNEEERFEKFVEEGTLGSFIAIKPNLAYYRKKLPKSSPQFFTVVYKISHGDPAFEQNIEAITKAVDFASLRTMLGK